MPKKQQKLDDLPRSYYHMKAEIIAMLESWDTTYNRYEVDTFFITKRTGIGSFTIHSLRVGRAKIENMTFKNAMRLYNFAKYCRNKGLFTAQVRMKLGAERPAISAKKRKRKTIDKE
ncbi:hypothetical protein [Streptococcus sciuri]|uniref:Uncharacterized protein n=1 Tax=Streptococcus sciuri TaxID=2973939 RepID=A0ABT2F5F6_9STRE|nr:hypothetical protein [Streptococcus sciuri]MCS4487664.1 hypothetical protein [Streptococcus sciuri]